MGIHRAKVYLTLKEFLNDRADLNTGKNVRYWTRIWKRHREKHGNAPFISKCAICSGKYMKIEVKLGKYKVSKRDKFDYKNETSIDRYSDE